MNSLIQDFFYYFVKYIINLFVKNKLSKIKLHYQQQFFPNIGRTLEDLFLKTSLIPLFVKFEFFRLAFHLS
jgi:hypothetical protein